MKRVHFIANKFSKVRRDIIKNKRSTDSEEDTTEAKVTQADLLGFDDDPSEAHKGQA